MKAKNDRFAQLLENVNTQIVGIMQRSSKKVSEALKGT